MKKLFLLCVAAGVSALAFGQKAAVTAAQLAPTNVKQEVVAAKTTAVGDTFYLPLFTSVDTPALYFADRSPYDSGFCTGMNAFGDKAWAQRWDVKASDSTVKVIGIISRFGGTLNPSSTRTVDLNVWLQGPKTVWFRPTLFNSGFPVTSPLATRTVNANQLGIAMTSTESDSVKLWMLSAATPLITQNFFVGAQMTYTWGSTAGDTIAVYGSRQGNRTAPTYYANSATDTTINNYNVSMYDDGTWHDNAVSNFNLYHKIYVRPVVVINAAINNGVAITNEDFTFHGNFPNPATNSTNISFGLATRADVTILVMDMSGRTVGSISKKGLAKGENTITLETADLAAGDYIYVINSSNGGGIASKFTVVK